MIYKPRLQAIFYNNPDGYPPIINSCRLLAQAGFSINLCCRDDGKQWGISYPPQVCVKRIKVHAQNSMQEYRGFIQRTLRYRNRKASLFIGHDMHGFLVARLLATHYRRPLIYHCHDYIDTQDNIVRKLSRGVRTIRAFEQRFARTADLVIVPDPERGAIMERELRLRKPPLIVANAPIARNSCSGEVLHEELSALGHHFEQIIFRQGRIGVGHAIEATIKSIPHWQNPQWGFVIMGSGESDYIENLLKLSRGLGVERQFVILPPVAYDEVAAFTPGATVGHALYEPIHVNNRHITTASNKIMEYMAARIPLLVSDTSSLRALVENYQCGLTANEKSPGSIALAVNQLLANPHQSKQMGVSAASAFEEVFCYEKQFAPVLSEINRLFSKYD